jgi:hypothetical protein
MSTYPAINEVGELFDVQLLWDFVPADESEDAPAIDVVTLGLQREMGAGLWGVDLTPAFYSIGELESWCRRHLSELAEIAERDHELPSYVKHWS